jgi:hypothetical protein
MTISLWSCECSALSIGKKYTGLGASLIARIQKHTHSNKHWFRCWWYHYSNQVVRSLPPNYRTLKHRQSTPTPLKQLIAESWMLFYRSWSFKSYERYYDIFILQISLTLMDHSSWGIQKTFTNRERVYTIETNWASNGIRYDDGMQKKWKPLRGKSTLLQMIQEVLEMIKTFLYRPICTETALRIGLYESCFKRRIIRNGPVEHSQPP